MTFAIQSLNLVFSPFLACSIGRSQSADISLDDIRSPCCAALEVLSLDRPEKYCPRLIARIARHPIRRRVLDAIVFVGIAKKEVAILMLLDGFWTALFHTKSVVMVLFSSRILMFALANPMAIMTWVEEEIVEEIVDNIHEDGYSKMEDSMFALFLADPESVLMWMLQ